MTTNTTTLPLSHLRIDDKANVRKIGRGVDPVLLASIKAIGLRQPLSVRPNGKGYIVTDGGQRLLALQEIAKADKSDPEVPVTISSESDAAAREVSLALNVARQAMHPVDEFRAFAALASDKELPLTAAQIAERFGVSERNVHQRLALGSLDDSVLNAWQAGEIDARIAKLFTMQPVKKAQKTALEKARAGYMNEYNIREALGINQERRIGRALAIIGEEAYIARGGKIARDLFAEGNSDNTMVSDPELIKTMVDEILDKEVARLQSEGWGTVTKEIPQTIWNYPRIDVTGKPTKEEKARLKEIEQIFEAAEKADESLENDEDLEAEKDAIAQAIELRALASLDAKVKAKGIAFVGVSHDWSRIEINLRQQPIKEKSDASSSGTADKSKKKTKPEDAVSQALMIRQAEQLTAAAQVAILKQPNVAVALLVAAITSHTDAVTIHGSGRDHRGPKFEAALASALKMTTAQQIEALTELVSRNINLVQRFAKQPVLDFPTHKAVVDAINGKTLTAATREKWDAKDFFASVSRATIVEAVREAMGDDHASKVAKMGKADAAKFATANLPKLKWLPKQLRVAGYDGPAKKAAPKKAKR